MALFKFALFVEWPNEAFANGNSDFCIGILGDDPFGGQLDRAVADKSVRGRKVQVVRHDSVEKTRDCHVLFISQSEKERLPQLMKALKGSRVLTVSDIEGL